MPKTLKSLYRPVLLGAAMLALSACQLLPVKEPVAGPTAAPAEAQPVAKQPALPFDDPAAGPRTLEADLVYSYLVAEVAAHRGDLALSYRHYLNAALMARDAYAAERATRIAVYLDDQPASMRAARLWVELAPNAQNARMTLALLLEHAGQRDAALAQLEALLQISEALGQDGFLQIAQVLAKEGGAGRLALMYDLATAHAADARAHYALALVAVAGKSLVQAETSLAQAVALAPRRAEPRVMLARVWHSQGRTKQALNSLAAALVELPDSRPLRSTYARMLVDAGRHADALREFRQLLATAPDDEELIYRAAMLATHEQAWDEAREYWLKLRNHGGKRFPEATYFLAQVEERRGREQVAAGLYEAVKEGPLLMDAGLRLAQIEARRGDVEQARGRLKRLRLLVPERAVDAYLAEAGLLKDAGRAGEARRLFDEALLRQPDDIELRYARAMFAAEQDDLGTLEQDLQHILSLDPDNVDALNALGYTLADRTRRFQESFGYIMHAYRLQPENAAILDSLGWVYYRLGDYASALRYLRQALDMAQDAEIAAHLGEVLWVTGDRAAARRVWRDGLARTPDSWYIRDTMERME
jgi:tetratricopeptide (TPR) repeat protein